MTTKEKNTTRDNVGTAMEMIGKAVNVNEVENFMDCCVAMMGTSPKASQGFINIINKITKESK